MSKHLEAILDECLSQLNNNETVEACLAQHPALAADIEPLLRMADQCRSLRPSPEPAPPALQAGRQRLLSAAAVHRTAQEERRATSRAPWRALGLLRKSAAAALLAVLLLAAVLGGGTIAASAKSLPGDTLYPVKRMTEDLQLVLTLGREAHAQLAVRLEERRREEARAILSSRRIADISFRGVLETQVQGCWTIAGVPVYLSNETQVVGDVVPGAHVRVSARSLSDGKLWATRIDLEPEQPTLAQPTAITLPSPTLPPTPSPTPNELPAVVAPTAVPPIPTLRPTSTARPSATPSPTPTEIPATATPSREVKLRFKGRIEAISDSTWIVGGQALRIDAQTRIFDQERQAALGAIATVLAVRQADGNLLALEIVTEREPSTPDQLFEFQGLIESFGPTQWVVGGYRCAITADTRVVGSPLKGLLAEVKALRRADGSLCATHIVVTAPVEEVQFEGSIRVFSAAEWTVDETVVRLDAETVIAGEPVVGCTVEVQGLLLADGAVLARRIVVQAPPTATPTPLPASGSSGDVTPTTLPKAPAATAELMTGPAGSPSLAAASLPTAQAALR
jgi:hypothetical protein